MSEPLRILSCGAGVQSSCLVYMAADGVIPKFDAVILADVGWEPPAVYENVERLKEVKP